MEYGILSISLTGNRAFSIVIDRVAIRSPKTIKFYVHVVVWQIKMNAVLCVYVLSILFIAYTNYHLVCLLCSKR